MATRSLNKVMLIGNLTRDPELRYTAQGTAVCNFGLATNRYWVTETGEKKEETEFHRLVAWNKLAELCSQLLAKGRKVYVEGRLQSRSWTGADGVQRKTTEIIISDMVILDSRRAFEEAKRAESSPEEEIDVSAAETVIPAEKSVEGKQGEGKMEVSEKAKVKVGEVQEKGGGVATLAKKKGDKKKKKTTQDEEEKKEEKVSPDEIPF